MKKILMTLTAVLCCWVTTTVFTACGDKDDETIEPPVQTRTLSAAEVCYLVHMPYNGRNICNYIVSYKEADGQEKSGMLADTAWVKRITVSDFPFTATINMNVQRNEAELTDSAYNFRVYYSVYSVTSIFSDGTRVETYRDATPTYIGLTCPARTAEAYIAERFPERLKAKSIELSTDGKVLYFQTR
ncbi:MAG: hypothetical protein IJQ44_00625 [Bacteroidaceae bacterium]|nr:hypothetical protein [Bacteroidaceae bacterium]